MPPLANIDTLTFAHITAPAGVQALHRTEANEGAVFQVASQFNCLEMISRTTTPSDGITIYIDDPTQGPACAMACPAGTVYRNYFVKHDTTGVNINGLFEGQETNQINNLAGVDTILNNTAKKYWKMENGYVIPDSLGSIEKLKKDITALTTEQVTAVENELRVGIHWATSVVPSNTYDVCQVYASAVPCAYPKGQPLPDHMPLIDIWEPFASLVLRAAYEATLAVATHLSFLRSAGNTTATRVKCYLTLLGGGAFGNKAKWIRDAINSALNKFSKYPLDVILVHHGTTIHTFWTDTLPKRPDTTTLPPASGLPPPTDKAEAAAAAAAAAATKAAKDKAAAAATKAAKDKAAKDKAAKDKAAAGPEATALGTKATTGTTAALEPTLLLDTTRIPTTLLLLGTSLVKSLLNIQASKQVELKVSDLIEFNSNLSNLPSLKNKETKNKLGDIDKIIDTNINKSEDLQVELAKYNIGITGNSIYIDTQISSNSTKKLPTVSQEELLRGLAKINKLPIFQNPEDIKKILLKIEREQSETTVKRLLEENFNITMTGTKVSIALI